MRSSYRFCAFLKKTEVVLVERRSLASYGILTHDRVSVCLSVTSRYCIKMTKYRITQNSHGVSPVGRQLQVG